MHKGLWSNVEEPSVANEFDSTRKRLLYETPQDISDLVRDVTVNEFVAGVQEIDDTQRKEITDILMAFRPTRLRKRLTWLKRNHWTGCSLLRFLRARIKKDADDWDQLIACIVDDDNAEQGTQSLRSNAGNLSDYLRYLWRPAMEKWFLKQDYYDQSEWHDGLGK